MCPASPLGRAGWPYPACKGACAALATDLGSWFSTSCCAKYITHLWHVQLRTIAWGRISFEQLSGVCPVHDSPSGRPDEQQKRHAVARPVLQAIGPHITLMYAAAPRNALRMIDLIQPDAAKARGSRSPHAPQLKAPRLVRFRPSSGQVADSEIRQAAHNCRRGSLPARPNPSLARSRRRWNVT